MPQDFACSDTVRDTAILLHAPWHDSSDLIIQDELGDQPSPPATGRVIDLCMMAPDVKSVPRRGIAGAPL